MITNGHDCNLAAEQTQSNLLPSYRALALLCLRRDKQDNVITGLYFPALLTRFGGVENTQRKYTTTVGGSWFQT